MGNEPSAEAVGDEEEPGTTRSSTPTQLGSADDITYQEIVREPPCEAASGMDVPWGAGMQRGEFVTTGAQLRGQSVAASTSTGAQTQQPVAARGEPPVDSGYGADSLMESRRSFRPQHDLEDYSQRFFTPTDNLFGYPASVSPPSGDYYTAPRPTPAPPTHYGAAAGPIHLQSWSPDAQDRSWRSSSQLAPNSGARAWRLRHQLEDRLNNQSRLAESRQWTRVTEPTR